jgi:hypothetical protein
VSVGGGGDGGTSFFSLPRFAVSPDVSELVVVVGEGSTFEEVAVVPGGGLSLSGGRVVVVVAGAGCNSRRPSLGVEYGRCCGRNSVLAGWGRVEPTEDVWLDVAWLVGKAKFVVVSAEVVVPTTGGAVSPGALMVEEAPLVDPSRTTS